MDKNIKDIIGRYLEGKISEAEMKRLSLWVSNEENKILFKKNLKQFYRNDAFNTKKALRHFEQNSMGSKILAPQSRKDFNAIRYAAAVIGIAMTVYTVVKFSTATPGPIDINEVTLEVGEGNVQILGPSQMQDIEAKNGSLLAKQRGDTLNYIGSKNGDQMVVYNTLRVPYGKTFGVRLSDNSYVHLNAGSKLKFPAQFVAGSPREVFLEGEGYFKVAKNKESPFIVHTNNVSTQVFGTEFNVSAYKEDKESNIVLVEGSIGVFSSSGKFDPKKDVLLKPNEMASTYDGGQVKVEQVDVSGHVAWVGGTLLFKNEDFSTIVQKLQRFYNVTIANNNLALKEKKFTGRFDIESVEQILETFRKTNHFNYTIEGKNIIINP